MPTFDTTAPTQVRGLQGYSVDPLFTVGETIDGYTPPGILDGIGAYEKNATTVRVLVNHELGNTVGYAYTLGNAVSLTGARVSYFDIDKTTRQIVSSGLAYSKVYDRTGTLVTNPSQVGGGFDRFCSSTLIEAGQFGGGRGLADRLYFTGEETGNGSEWILDVATGELWAAPDLGRGAWENVTELDTGTTDKVAFLLGDDTGGAPMYLYVGTKNAAGANILERNGLTGGTMYVWVADDPANAADVIEANPSQFKGTGNSLAGQWVAVAVQDVAQAGNAGFDAQGYKDASKLRADAIALGAFSFSRPEDLATNPSDGTQAILASTGRGQLFGGADNWGTTYLFDTDFSNIGTGNITASVKILYDGDDAGAGVFAGPDFGLRSPDNLDWADDGFVYIQEDRSTVVSSDFGGTSGQEASIWRLDPNAANPAASLTRVAQVDRSALPSTQTDPVPTEIGNWETSGILDVSTLFGADPGELILFDVQAHSLRNGTIASENLVEGGQLSFLSPYADTSAPAQVKGLNGYVVDPVFTIGETLTGTTGALNSTSAGNYTLPGILDGIGAYEKDANTVRVLVNHELGNSVGYAYTLENAVSLTGARVSYLDIDKNTLKIVDGGLAFRRVYDRTGTLVTNPSQVGGGFDRFCSSTLIEAGQFGGGRGLADRLYFTGEETGNGSEWILDVATGELWAAPDLGRGAWENVTELDTGTTDKVAFLLGDDTGGAPMYLYVGTKNAAGANILERNGLTGGTMYVWVADDPANAADVIEANPSQFKGTGNSLAGQWVAVAVQDVAQAGNAGFDAQGYKDASKLRADAIALGAFSFSRPEDLATNPSDGTQAILASTGRGQLFGGADNWGTTYLFDTDFSNIGTGNITASVKILYDGDDAGAGVFAGPDFGLRSPDNLDWADDGFVYIQEDRSTVVSSDFGGTSGQEASIWRLDPNAANPAASLTRVAQVDRSAVPSRQTDPVPTEIGNWETSGILDVSALFGEEPGQLLLADVQAHSLRNGTIASENLVEGGQLLFIEAPDGIATDGNSSGNPTDTVGIDLNDTDEDKGIIALLGSLSLAISLNTISTSFVNELVVFEVADGNGSVRDANGNLVTPGTAGFSQEAYLQAILGATTTDVVLSTLDSSDDRPDAFPYSDIDGDTTIPGKGRIGFLLVVDGSLGEANSHTVFISTLGGANITNITSSGFTLAFGDDGGFDDLIFSVVAEAQDTLINDADEFLKIGRNTRMGNEFVEVIDLANLQFDFNNDGTADTITGQNIAVQATLYREAAFNNLIGFYTVAADGSVNGIAPTASNRQAYAQAAFNSRVGQVNAPANESTATTTFTFEGGSLLMPFLIANASSPNANFSNIYFPFMALNADGADHIRLLSNGVFGFEDLPGGGDQDFDDMIVRITSVELA